MLARKMMDDGALEDGSDRRSSFQRHEFVTSYQTILAHHGPLVGQPAPFHATQNSQVAKTLANVSIASHQPTARI